MQRKSRLFLLLSLFLFILAGQVMAQSDDTFTGDIENDRDEDEYTIELDEGDGVIITALAADGSDLDTVLTLENEDGDTVAENDDYEFPESTNSRIAYVAEDDGDYTIIIGNYPGSEGDYELTVEYVSAEEAEDLMNSGDSIDIDELIGEPDLEFDGFMSDDVNDDLYEIELEEGQGVVINAVADDSDLDTYLVLLNEDGDEVAVNDDVAPGEDTNSQIVYVAEEDGDYTITMSNYPGSEGDYLLTVSFIEPEDAENLESIADVEPEIDTTPERDPDLEFTGENDDEEEIEYPLDLVAGDGVIAAVYETDGMDTTLAIIDPNGVEIGFNDDRGDYSTFDSQVGFTAQIDGEYTIVVSNFPGFPGEYRLEIYFATPEEVSLAEQAMREILSGPIEIVETEHFRIHFTQEGDDAADPDFIEDVAETVEEVYDIQINQQGWVAPPSDLGQGGDERYDVYIVNITDAYGYASSSSPLGDNPNTADIIEEAAQAGYLVLDNDYSDYNDPMQAMRATAAHEFHHVVQFGYDRNDLNWYYESTSSWLETTTFPEDEEATIYVEDVFTYPEACFGGDGDADPSGLGIYGTWLFFEYMDATLGEEAPFTLWNNIAVEDGWDSLEITLEDYDETIPSFVAQYHINNLVRDYIFVDSFDGETVWLENTIDDVGDWSYTGEGVQELGVNYYVFDLDEGLYELQLDGDDDLELYVIGIDGDDGDVFALGSGGTVDTDSYDTVHVMVFNTDFDGDVLECDYEEYEISVDDGAGEAAEASMEVDASNFRELEN